MGKKIPLWVLLLVVFLGVNFTVLFGWAVYHTYEGGEKLGKLGPVILVIAKFPSLVKEVFFEAPGRSSLLIDNRFPEIDGFKKNGVPQAGAISDSGYLLLSAYDNSKKQSTVKLIRISDQQVVQEWVPNILLLAKHPKPGNPTIIVNDLSTSRVRIGHPFLLNNGSLIFHNLDGPLFNIDFCSNINWTIDQQFHHSIEQDRDGNFWVSSVIEPASYDKMKFIGYRDDAIAKVSPDGRVLFKKSVSKILEENGYRGLLFGAGPYENDSIHLNEIQPALYSTEYWLTGDLLLSIRNRSTIFIYRPDTNKIIWLKTGPWLNQHDPDFLGESKISLFGNDVIRDKGRLVFVNGQNNIYLFDFKDRSVSTPYSDVLRKLDVRTPTQGRQKVFKNGDLFVEESDYGRILRVSPTKEVWEFVVRVDNQTAGMISWSRYLTSEEVKVVLPLLEGLNCPKI
jgi:hypothetical protein